MGGIELRHRNSCLVTALRLNFYLIFEGDRVNKVELNVDWYICTANLSWLKWLSSMKLTSCCFLGAAMDRTGIILTFQG